MADISSNAKLAKTFGEWFGKLGLRGTVEAMAHELTRRSYLANAPKTKSPR